MSKLFVDLNIALRSLIQHSRRALFLGTAIGSVTALLILLNGLSTGIRETMIDTATTLSSGHLNVGGFYKITAGQAGPVVTDYQHVLEVAKKSLPEMAFAVERGRGWAKLVSDTGSMQVGISGIDIRQEPRIPAGLADHQRQARRPGRAGHDPDLRQPGREAEREGGRRAHDLGADHARREQHHRRAGGGDRARHRPAQHVEHLRADGQPAHALSAEPERDRRHPDHAQGPVRAEDPRAGGAAAHRSREGRLSA